MRRKIIVSVLISVVLATVGGCKSLKKSNDETEKVKPVKVSLPLHDETEMVLGDSRTVEVLFFSDNNDLTDPGYKTVTEKGVEWTTKPEGIVSIDKYGRLETLKNGTVDITAKSTANPKLSDTKTINVVDNATIDDKPKKSIVHFKGEPAETVNNLQKIVERYDLVDLDTNADVPATIKEAIKNPVNSGEVKQGDVVWDIVNFADGSDGKYVVRTDTLKTDSDRDKVQYFIGERYLPGNGQSPEMIFDDGNNGIWVVGDLEQNPQITHIKMLDINYLDKAVMMSDNTHKYVSRMGMTSDVRLDGDKWITRVCDNDGLWTSMFDAGELMRYAVLRDEDAPVDEIAAARESALKSLKALLLIANISGRDEVVDARIRYLDNVRIGPGNYYPGPYLKKGADLAVDNYSGSPADAIGFMGEDAGKIIDGTYYGGEFKYSLGPQNPEDWTEDGEPATTKRNLKGFLARSFYIPEIESPGSGIYFQRNADDDGGQKVIKEASRLYDYEDDELPIIQVGNQPIPEILMDVLFVDGKQYQAEDVAYKGDTSTDEFIGHLFAYKVAYDVLNDNDPEEKTLKDLTVETVTNFAQHFINNGYGMVDATGQGTSWGKTTRNYLNSDYTVEDRSLNSLVILCTFKLAYYMTDEIKWQDEYLLLAESEDFRYADLASTYWDQWMWMVENNDLDPEENLYRLNSVDNPSDIEKTRHAAQYLNYSDEEMAMLAYYILFQIEEDEELLAKYRAGLEDWWQSVSFSENPLWYYIYQLAYPDERKTDAFGNDVIETASWALNRHPVDTRSWQAFIDGSRPDVLVDNEISIDPDIVIGTRTSKTDMENADNPTNKLIFPEYNPENIYQIKVLPQDERSYHRYNRSSFTNNSRSRPTNMEASTTYSLPYWMGRYHNMIKK